MAAVRKNPSATTDNRGMAERVDQLQTGTAQVDVSDLVQLDGKVVQFATGTTAADNATAGRLGEVIASSVVVGSAVALTTATPANVTSISLTAGDWDVEGSVGFHPAATTSITNLQAWDSTTTAALPTFPTNTTLTTNTIAAVVPNADIVVPLGYTRINVSATTTLYLSAQAAFTVSTLGAYGYISARRVR